MWPGRLRPRFTPSCKWARKSIKSSCPEAIGSSNWRPGSHGTRKNRQSNGTANGISTYEVFRDLGLAFAAVMVLIYVLVVAWFSSFTTPLVIMAPIPLTLIGILPGHALFGAFFTATSMIGFIALAGIIVRNSIILIDFTELRRREGMALDEAIIDAGAVRFRPMLLTGAAVVVGSFVIVFDPIFQGLALALMCGEIASTTLSRVTVPVLYYMVQSWKEKRHEKRIPDHHPLRKHRGPRFRNPR